MIQKHEVSNCCWKNGAAASWGQFWKVLLLLLSAKLPQTIDW